MSRYRLPWLYFMCSYTTACFLLENVQMCNSFPDTPPPPKNHPVETKQSNISTSIQCILMSRVHVNHRLSSGEIFGYSQPVKSTVMQTTTGRGHEASIYPHQCPCPVTAGSCPATLMQSGGSHSLLLPHQPCFYCC